MIKAIACGLSLWLALGCAGDEKRDPDRSQRLSDGALADGRRADRTTSDSAPDSRGESPRADAGIDVAPLEDASRHDLALADHRREGLFTSGDSGARDARPDGALEAASESGLSHDLGGLGSGDSNPGDSSPGDSSPGDSRRGDSSPGDSSPGDSSPGNLPDGSPSAETRPAAFAITAVAYPRVILSGGPRGSLSVSWSGTPTFPLVMTYRPRPGGCPPAVLCSSPTMSFSVSANPLVFPSAVWCSGANNEIFFDYEVILSDANDHVTEPFPAAFTCMGNISGGT